MFSGFKGFRNKEDFLLNQIKKYNKSKKELIRESELEYDYDENFSPKIQVFSRHRNAYERLVHDGLITMGGMPYLTKEGEKARRMGYNSWTIKKMKINSRKERWSNFKSKHLTNIIIGIIMVLVGVFFTFLVQYFYDLYLAP